MYFPQVHFLNFFKIFVEIHHPKKHLPKRQSWCLKIIKLQCKFEMQVQIFSSNKFKGQVILQQIHLSKISLSLLLLVLKVVHPFNELGFLLYFKMLVVLSNQMDLALLPKARWTVLGIIRALQSLPNMLGQTRAKEEGRHSCGC